MELLEFFLKQKQVTRRRTLEVLQLIRPEYMAWKPEPNALSVGKMLRHMWVSEEGSRKLATDGDFAYYDARIPHGLDAVIGTVGSLEEELKNLDRVHRETLASIGSRPPSFLDEERSDPKLGFRRKVSVILFGINEHEVHHRAQLSTYLRMRGTPVPEPFERPAKSGS